MTSQTVPLSGSFAALRGFVRKRPAAEHCELCASPLAAEHEHLLETGARRLACACTPCAILFSGQPGARYRRVPRRIEFLGDFHMSDLQWEALMQTIVDGRNDLETPAIALAPAIADVLAALRDLPGCRLARMSGSGATCFAVFDSARAASAAARQLRAKHPPWWVRATVLGGS